MAQICWFGQPSQADALPASSASVPGQSVKPKHKSKECPYKQPSPTTPIVRIGSICKQTKASKTTATTTTHVDWHLREQLPPVEHLVASHRFHSSQPFWKLHKFLKFVWRVLEGVFHNDWKAHSSGLLNKQSQTKFADYDELINHFNSPEQLAQSDEESTEEKCDNQAKETLVCREMWTSRGFAAASMWAVDSYGSFRRRSANSSKMLCICVCVIGFCSILLRLLSVSYMP